MAKLQRWLLLRADGSVAEQLKIVGDAPPSEHGHDVEGLSEIKVGRHGDLSHEHWDAGKGRWISDKAKKAEAERRFALRGMAREELVEMVLGKIDELGARVTALEEKGK